MLRHLISIIACFTVASFTVAAQSVAYWNAMPQGGAYCDTAPKDEVYSDTAVLHGGAHRDVCRVGFIGILRRRVRFILPVGKRGRSRMQVPV